jgi:hypothetical protein
MAPQNQNRGVAQEQVQLAASLTYQIIYLHELENFIFEERRRRIWRVSVER